MDSTGNPHPLPPPEASYLELQVPSHAELQEIYRMSFAEWGDSLTLPQFLEESDFLAAIPLAKDRGMDSWILTDNRVPVDKRPILASCETFRKRALVVNRDGQLSERMIHGIASVFVNPSHRRQGYAASLMRHLKKQMPSWDVGPLKSVGSILYSDIGPAYYAELGWLGSPANSQVEFEPRKDKTTSSASHLTAEHLSKLCQEDEARARQAMTQLPLGRSYLMIVPSVDHMLWHMGKEEFSCMKLFGKNPQAKGAIAGKPGNRVWIIWAHRYYSHPDVSPEDNVLYLLRCVLENERPNEKELELQAESMKAVLESAQKEAFDWELHHVKLWNPIPAIQTLLERCSIPFQTVERTKDSIACLAWFEPGVPHTDVEWIANEKYAWC